MYFESIVPWIKNGENAYSETVNRWTLQMAKKRKDQWTTNDLQAPT